MESKYIWVITNDKDGFIKACATRETALAEMKKWRESCAKVGIFADVTDVDAVYYEHISFEVTHRDGAVHKMKARQTVLY